MPISSQGRHNLPLIRVWGRSVAKILVVDDDAAVQTMVRLLLERAGHSVIAASDGRAGLAAFESGRFDLLLLDIFMPAMDGLETMRSIHQREPAMPIIVMSGRSLVVDAGAEPDFLAMATKLGAVRSLPKPFRPESLLSMVDACLAGLARGRETG
jgi:CheY-like chemotaxis protein